MPKSTAAPSAASRPQPQARFRFRITAGETIAIGPGKIALLEAVAQTGSITTAAKSLDMSYRRAWLLLDELNKALKSPAVDSSKGGQHGGGTALTPVGEQLVATYRGIEKTAEKACAAEIRQLVRLLNR
jgi:molybdate transport system regulatory protein